ncbi:MAG: dihydrolipoamide acetyltransferase family protein [Candidatus Micrarchaeota archaeon]
MAVEFRFPDVGEGITEGELLKWLVLEGGLVRQDQAICEVETDKAVVELPSPIAGVVLKLHVAAGTKIKVGQVIATIGEKGEKIFAATDQPKAAAIEPTASKTEKKTEAAAIQSDLISKTESPNQKTSPKNLQAKTQSSIDSNSVKSDSDSAARALLQKSDLFSNSRSVSVSPLGVRALPHTRKLGRTLGIDLNKIRGTGPGGRITDADVRSFGGQATVPSVSMAVPKQGGTLSDEKHGLEERIPLAGIRKTISEKVSVSYHTAVHVSAMDEIEVSALVAVREKEKKTAQEHGIHLTFLPFIIKAVVVALRQYPIFNASLDDETNEIVLKHYYHIGIAVDTEDGLIVPVIKNADQKSMFELAIEIQELAKACRERKIALNDLRGSSFSITNYGSVGAQFGTPIINYPNVAILGVGKIVPKPVVKNGLVVAGLVLPLTFTFDHRIADGAQAAAFLGTVLQLLADPDFLLVESR